MVNKKSIVKILCTKVFIIASMMGNYCFAQEIDTLITKMLPEIPHEINEPTQRAEYLVLHFWDNFNFSDTAYLMNDHLLERCFVDFIDLLSLVPYDVTEKSIGLLLKKSEETHSLFSFILKLSEQYLYEPASPVCDEEKLIPFLRYVIQSSSLQDIEKIRPNYLLENCLKNRIGTVANDFTYTLMNGEKDNLHAINAEYTLLYFNDPDCGDCQLLIKQLTTSPIVNQLIESGKLKIITVYVNEDLEAWEKHASDVLHTWTYSYDAEQKINFEVTYDIKHFPTIYLLDHEKKVILKDTTFEKLDFFLKRLI